MDVRTIVQKNGAYYLIDPNNPDVPIGVDQISECLNNSRKADKLLVIIESMVDRLAHHETQAYLKEQGIFEKFKLFPTNPEYGLQKCCICGCTDNNACLGGCSWSAPNMCSNCVSKAVEHLMCEGCTLPMLAKTLSFCSTCKNVNCDKTCDLGERDAHPVCDEAPPCETWECKNREYCEWGFITGFLIRGNVEDFATPRMPADDL